MSNDHSSITMVDYDAGVVSELGVHHSIFTWHHMKSSLSPSVGLMEQMIQIKWRHFINVSTKNTEREALISFVNVNTEKYN